METMMADPDSLSRLELISLYINDYYTLDAERRAAFEAAFRKRKLPLPRIPEARPTVRKRAAPMDRNCFLSYILLIYTGTAIFYSWFFLLQRIVKLDFTKKDRHKFIQTGIALFYVIAEILLFDFFSAGE
jgi:hypothetical protein